MKMKMNILLAGALLSLLGAGAAAQGTANAAVAQPAAAASTSAWTGGVVRKVDAEQKKITIRHEPIADLDMPAMTMVFRAGSPELLNGIKAGDKIRFRAVSDAGALTLTELEAAN